MPTLKEKIENNLVVFFFTALVVGFGSGIGVYQSILKISGRITIASEAITYLKNDLQKKTSKVSTLESRVRATEQELQKTKRSLIEPKIKEEEVSLADYGFLYSEFVKGGGTIVLSNPPVYRYLNKGDHDALVAHFKKESISEIPQQLLMELNILDIGYEKEVGDVAFRHVIQSRDEYTGIGEALGLQRIKGFFIKHRINPIKITQSRFGYSEENLILLGGWISHSHSQKFIAEIAEFLRYWHIPYRTYGGAIHLDGEKLYEPTRRYQRTSFEIQEDYAIITKIPNPFNLSNTVIICAGINSQGTEAASRIISEDKEIDRLRTGIEKKLGSIPNWFQVIIKIPVADGQPLRDWKFMAATPVSRRE